jgi:genome maintenance exonuclease 1
MKSLPSRFVHKPLAPEYKLERVQKEDGRYYVLPSGAHVPSVTTVLGRLDTGWLEKWIARVGKEKAERVSTQAKLRGTAIHDLCEQYLRNEDTATIKKGSMPINWADFRKIAKILDENVGDVYGVEYRLFSEELGAAGTSDLIGTWNGVNAIIDFKTSKYEKDSGDIFSYFIQATCYALMVEELYGLSIPKIVIIISVDHEPKPLIFERDKAEFIEETRSIFKR